MKYYLATMLTLIALTQGYMAWYMTYRQVSLDQWKAKNTADFMAELDKKYPRQ